MTDSAGPLAAFTVVDLTRWQAGSYVGLVMADLGATVIKVEKPPVGDPMRAATPFSEHGMDANHISFNRGKRSVALDYSGAAGRSALQRLIERADVFVENFKPGVAEALGIGYEAMRERNPRLVYCSVSGFGQTGPYRDHAAYDNVIQAMAGTMSLTGPAGGPPQLTGLTIGDLGGSLFATIAVLAALARPPQERGEWIDVALLDSQVALLSCFLQYQLTADYVTPARGDSDQLVAGMLPLPTADDRPIYVGALQDNHFAALARLVGRGELAADPRYATYAARARHRDELHGLLAAAAREHAHEPLLDGLRRAGVPAGPINTLRDLAQDAQLHAREMITETTHPDAGVFRVVGNPIKSSRPLATAGGPPPTLGEHTGQVLRSIAQLTPEEIDAVVAEAA